MIDSIMMGSNSFVFGLYLQYEMDYKRMVSDIL